MLEIIENLLTVQARDQKLRSYQLELASLPQERAAREKQLVDSAARLEKAKTRAKEIEVEKRALEVEAQTRRDNIARYKQQQLQTRKNDEYTALAHEIESAEKSISGLEDKELDLMDEAERLKPEIAEAEKIHAEEKGKIQQVLAALETKENNLDSLIVELKKDRAQSAEGIDEDVLERYDRLFKNKQGTAVVALEGEICTGCHMKVTTQTVVAVKAGREVVHCPQCGRMLYFPA